MEYECGEYFRRGHVPVFGSWDWNDVVPFTECFETATHAGLIRYSYEVDKDRDLNVAGDLYDNRVVTPAMIVVPRRKVGYERRRVKGVSNERNWAGAARETDAPLEPSSFPAPKRRPTPKPVDQDLYRISPEILDSKFKRGWSCFTGCFLPSR